MHRALILGGLLSIAFGCAKGGPDDTASRAAQVHLQVAQAAWDVLDAAGRGINAECTVERLQAEGLESDFRRRCDRAFAAQPAAVAAYRTWVTQAAAQGLDVAAVFAAFQDLVELYGALREVMATFGRPIPAATELFQ